MRKYLNILLPGIKYLILRVTGRCNAGCPFCLNRYYQNAPAAVTPELSVSEYEKIAACIPNLALLNLSGGEPYLREDLAEIAGAFITRSGVRLVSSPTNGSLPERAEEFAQRLLSRHPGVLLKVGISIDGVGDEHDQIRGIAGGYGLTLETARRLQGVKKRYSNLMVHAVTTVSSQNVYNLAAVMGEIKATSLFDGHFFALVRGHGPEMRLTAEEFEIYRQATATLQAGDGRRGGPLDAVFRAIIKTLNEEVAGSYLDRKNTFRCLAGRKMINITEQGELCICEILENPSLGNLRDHGYDPARILALPGNAERLHSLMQKECDCHWDCAVYSSILFGGIHGYSRVLRNIFRA